MRDKRLQRPAIRRRGPRRSRPAAPVGEFQARSWREAVERDINTPPLGYLAGLVEEAFYLAGVVLTATLAIVKRRRDSHDQR